MKKSRKLLPKGDSPYAKWARRWGLKRDWVASVAALFSMAYLPLIGYYMCGREERGAVINLFSLGVLGLTLHNSQPEIVSFLRYLLVFYPIYDTYMITKDHQLKYEKEFGSQP
jgi:hypothetical protein